MKLGFMSSVCPRMSLAELIAAAREYGFAGIEFRAEWEHGHGVELETPADQLEQKRKQLADSGIEAACLATGARFCADDAKERTHHADEFRMMIDLAVIMGIPRLRVFGDPLPTEPAARSENLARQREQLAPLAELAQEVGVVLCLETHGNMTGTDVAEVIEPIDVPALCALWHPLHPFRNDEPLETTWSKIGARVAHCHFSVEEHVGEQRNHECFALLQQAGYTGYQSVEIIDPPDGLAVLKQYADYFKQFMGQAECPAG